MAAVGAPDRMSWSIFIEAHRAQVSRRRNFEERDRVLAFARDPVVLRWIEHELFGEPVSSSIVDSLTDVVATLTLSPPPWPRYLIIDAAELSEPDIRLLGAIREAGWPGAVIAIGDASTDAHRSLGIDAVVPRTLGCEVLRNELKRARAVALRAFEQKRA